VGKVIGMAEVTLYLGNCIDILPDLSEQSIEAIITDLPYGTTACAWDTIIPLAPMWEQVKRVIKSNGVFITTACQPFSSMLVMSNLEWFKYELIYEKTSPKGFLSSRYRPLTAHENILVFGRGSITYNPQKWKIPEYLRTKRKHSTSKTAGEVYGKVGMKRWDDNGWRQPSSVIGFSNHAERENNYHPTQKPVALYDYLIRTYTNPGDTVLDFCAGSGTTGIAALENGRKVILIEKNLGYYKIIERRIELINKSPKLFFTGGQS